MAKTTLAQLPLHTKAIITGFSDDELTVKFLEMGCVPGEIVLIEHIAPLGSPIGLRVCGYLLALRKEEAEKIVVDVMMD